MPALSQGELKQFLRVALLAPGDGAFVKNTTEGPIPGILPDTLEDFVDRLAAGLSNAWTAWQARQTVAILPPPVGAVIDTVTAAPVTGVSGPGSLP